MAKAGKKKADKKATLADQLKKMGKKPTAKLMKKKGQAKSAGKGDQHGY